MKLSYREKIVLLVITLLLVVLVFVLWPIKSIRGDIKKHEEQRDQVKVVYDENNKLIAEIPTIEKNITKIYNDSKGLNKEFIVHKENFQIDQYIQELVNAPEFIDGDKNKFEVIGDFKQEDPDASELKFYYYTPKTVTYPILENADTNGDMLASTDKALYTKVMNAVAMNLLEQQDVEIHSATIKAKFTKEGLFAFVDGLMKKDTGVRVTSIKVENYHFTQQQVEDFASDPNLQSLQGMDGYSKGDITLEFYTMQQIQEPKFEKK